MWFWGRKKPPKKYRKDADDGAKARDNASCKVFVPSLPSIIPVVASEVSKAGDKPRLVTKFDLAAEITKAKDIGQANVKHTQQTFYALGSERVLAVSNVRTVWSQIPPEGGGSGAHPNEPAGFTVFCEHRGNVVPGLDDAAIQNGIYGWWWHRGEDSYNLSVGNNGDDGASPPDYYTFKFPHFLADGVTPFPGGIAPAFVLGWDTQTFGDGEYPGLEELYGSVWLRVRGNASSSTANDGINYENQPVLTKLWYHAYKSDNHDNQSTLTLHGNGLVSYATSWDIDFRASQVAADGSESPGQALQHLQNVDATKRIILKQFNHIEWYMKRNSLRPRPINDGTMKVWVDGHLVMNYGPATGNGIRYCSTQFPKGFHQFRNDPVWGGTGSVKTRDDYIDFGHVYISGKVATPYGPNEPSGFVPVAYSQFDVLPNLNSGTTPSGWRNPWTRFNSGLDYTQIINDPTAPTGNGKCLRITYPGPPNALSSGIAPCHIWTNWESTAGQKSEIYMHWWFRLYGNGTDFEMNPVGLKMTFFSGPTSGVDNEFVPFTLGNGVFSARTSFPLQLRQQNTTTRNISQNVDLSNVIVVGAAWQRMEIYCKTNTIGSANGLLKMWINGVQTHDYSDVVWRTAGAQLKFRNLNLNPTYGGAGPSKTRDDYYDISEIYISGKA